MKRKLLVLLLALASILILLSSCSGEMFDDDEIRAYTEEMIDALIAGDSDAAYSVVADACTKNDFNAFYKQIRPTFENIDDYSLELISYNTKTNVQAGETVTTVEVEYLLKSDDFECIVKSATRTGYKKLAGINFNSVENTDYYCNGTLSNMSGASLWQWLVLLLNIPVIAFTVFAVYDCARKDIKKKFVWLLIIFLGNVLVRWTFARNGFNFNFNIGLFNFSALVMYGSGKTVLGLVLPIGPIIYFVKRKALVAAASVNTPQEQYNPMFSEATTEEANEQTETIEIYCKNCGTKLDSDAKFCIKCGEKIGE